MSRPATMSEFAARAVIGQRLRWWRASRGHSQYTLAEVIGISQPALSNYEAGKRDIPLSVAAAIASELNVSLGDFTGTALPEPAVIRDPRLRQVVQVLADRPELVGAIASLCLNVQAISETTPQDGRSKGRRAGVRRLTPRRSAAVS